MKDFTLRQEEIILAAMEIIAKQGLAELSMKNIAAQIGIKESSIYNHFESKKAILNGIYHLYENKLNKLIESIEDEKSSYINKLKVYYFHICSNIKTSLTFSTLLIREFFHYDPYYQKDYQNLLMSSHKQMLDIIDKAKLNNEIRNDLDSDFVFATIFSCIRILYREVNLSQDYDIEKNKKRLWTMIVKVISPS